MKFAGMEEDNHHHNQDLKFVCKQCNKRYPCGKSLGGHMRSHVIANSAEIMEEKSDPKRDQNQNQSRFEHGGYSTYGLRENPKKTWRAVDSTSPLPQEKACKQCGKVFQSLKALCGHMACHSEKDRGGGVKDDHSWNSSESKKLEEEEEEEEEEIDDDDDDEEESDDDSDTEAEEEQIQIPTTTTTTTDPKRYKKIVVKSYSLSVTNNNNNNSIGSSSVSEIDEQEQEEVAKCLMMLSKDSGNWYGSHVNSVVEFSDNNSVVLETKSSSIDMKKRNNTKVCCYKDNETPPTKKMEDRGKQKLKSSIVVESQSSDSGYFLGENKVESSDVSVNGLHTKRKVHEFGVASNYGKKKRTTNDTSYDPEVETGSYNNNNNKKMKLGLKIGSSPSGTKNANNNKKKYECLNCKKSFSSYQALGGHRPCHKKTNADHESSYGTGENSLDADDTYNKIRDSFGRKKVKDSSEKKANNKATKKGKGHECPFCHRMFKSGQALGGHKRSHFIGGAQVINGNNHHQTPPPVVAKEEVTDLLDLNLPAPVDEDEEQMMGW